MTTDALGGWGLPLAILAGALRGSVPFLWLFRAFGEAHQTTLSLPLCSHNESPGK